MAKQRHNPNLAKIHRNYTVDETANLFGVHKNTVRYWIKAGLPICDERRPTLILGEHLQEFLKSRRRARKRRCRVDEVYCMRCRVPKKPAGDMVDYEAMTATSGRLVAICPSCEATINQYVRLARLEEIRLYLDVSISKTVEHIGDSNRFLVNSDFE